MLLYALSGLTRLADKWPLLDRLGVAPALVFDSADDFERSLAACETWSCRTTERFGCPPPVHLPFRGLEALDSSACRRLCEVAEAVCCFGARDILMHAFLDDARAPQTAAAALAPVAAAVERAGARLWIENTVESCPQAFLTVATALGAGVVLDLPRCRHFSAIPPAEWLARAATRLGGLHVYGDGGDDRHEALGEADRHWLCPAVARAGASPLMLLDVGRADLAASAERLRGWLWTVA
jgi:hypothetical protein